MKKIALYSAGIGGASLIILMGSASILGDIEEIRKSLSVIISLAMIAFSLLLYCIHLLKHYQNRAWHHGLLLLHAGLLIALVAEGGDYFYSNKGLLFAREGMATSFYYDKNDTPVALSFSIFCENFKTELYPESLKVSSYRAILNLTEGDQSNTLELYVNQPLTYKDVTLHLQNTGIEPGDDAYIDLTVTENGTSDRYQTMIDAPLSLPSGTILYIRDFSPSLAYKDGIFYTSDFSTMSNPAYFVELFRPGEPPLEQWILTQNSDTHQLGGLHLTIHDFYGIEYVVISIVHHSLQWLTYLGLALVVIGIMILMRRKLHVL